MVTYLKKNNTFNMARYSFPDDVYLFKAKNGNNKKCVKSIKVSNKDNNDVVLASLLLTLKRFHALF